MIWIATLVGWLLGSFLNTLVDRTAHTGEPSAPLFQPVRSRCPKCEAQLHWYDLLPIASYLLLQGHCRICHAAIGRRTLVVEVLTPILFAGFAWLLTMIEGYPAWGAVAGFGFGALSWLIVAVLLLLEGRAPRPTFLAMGMGLFAALAVTAIVMALDAMTA